jgi:type II secretory pathway pseudopilin PulG
MKERRGSEGFTVVEFVIAALFIGALAIVAVSFSSDSRGAERDNARIADIKQLEGVLRAYFNEHGGYPSALEGYIVNDGTFERLPRDPKTSKPYFYAALNRGCTSFHLGALLERADHSVLLTDADFSDGERGIGCPDGSDSTEDFSGADPVYDVRP